MKTTFAVSALTAAISASAIAADTEWEFTFEGSMDAYTSIDIANHVNKDVALDDDDDEQEGWDLELDMAITNGPLSAGFYIDAGDEQDGEAVLELDDITVTDGKLTFGQVGSLMSTDDYLDIEDTPIAEVVIEKDSVDEVLGVDAGFTYEVTEGLLVQLQGSNFNSADDAHYYGLAAQYAGDMDALSYVVEAEYVTDDAKGDNLPYLFSGAGATYSIDSVTAKGYVNYFGFEGDLKFQYGIHAETTVAAATLELLYIEPNSEEKNDQEVELSASYPLTDEFTVSAGYTYTTASDGDEVTSGVEWAKDALTASADVTFSDFDAKHQDPILVELETTYTSELGVEYYAQYDIQASDTEAGVTSETNIVTLGARYAF